MKPNKIFQTLLCTTQSAYSMHNDLMGFAPFPTDIVRQDVIPYHRKCSDYFGGDRRLISKNYQELQDAIVAASDFVYWRETYKDTAIGGYFMDRFGCYCIIGNNAPFSSNMLRLFMVYLPPGLYYPWHHHPAEEMYMVVSGRAIFKQRDCTDEMLSEGQVAFHASNKPHAMETKEDPVLCLVAWRNGFETLPCLTAQSDIALSI